MNFSAKKLLSCSAKQLCYFMHNPQKDTGIHITEWVMDGQRFQQHIFESLGRAAHDTEMGGCFETRNGDKVFFSHDIVARDGSAIFETKRLNEGEVLSSDYLNKSALQCAVYDTLTRFSSPHLFKSKFARDLGDDANEITLVKSYKYYLVMGKHTFLVTLRDPYPILTFVQGKINASKNYDSASEFDTIWKGKEYDKLRGCFTVERF